MSDLSFRQKAAQQAVVKLRADAAKVDARTPFSAALGNISISLRVCVGRPFYRGLDGVEHRCGGDQTLVVLAMSSLPGSSPTCYQGWGNEGDAAEDAARATLNDDLGTRYVRATTSQGLESWVGQVSGSRILEPGETLTDVLVFSPPHPKASKLTLELPRSNWGMSGVLRLDVPVGRIVNFPGTIKLPD